MSETDQLRAQAHLPSIQLDKAAVDRARKELDIEDRSQIVTYGDAAQRQVSDFADRILAETRNKEMGKTGELLSDILAKARGLDPAAIGKLNWFQRLFTSMEARVRRFKERFEDVAGQVDRVTIELDRHKETLRSDIAMLDELHEQTKTAIAELDVYIEAGKTYGEEFKAGRLAELKAEADAKANTTEGLMAAQVYQDALQALDRLEKRVMYLQQARQIGFQQLPQIRIVQAGDETLIENLQATTQLTIPVWKQKMILLLGLSRQNSALEMQKTVTDATNEMLKQASEMMKTQAIEIERQSQRGIIDIETLEKTNRDLIDTITGVLKVQDEGRRKRVEVERKLGEMTQELKKQLSARPSI
ncbi:toxic anion resistance protein [Rhabdaerophilum sp. SD176]|uniref:toxic anion resistance protein n=1 Tax=Rhabdaerophilum sp. SD176 TaxID=2983548 RepID=UPI0024E01D4C|nr:toxic anion resistance protein [Rhabdaerophilum sp. SD176]